LVNFIIVTHGEFGAYLVEAAEAIVGPQKHGVRVVSISTRLSVPEIRERIRKAIAELGGPDGLVLFSDMPGGTPGNLSFPLLKDNPRAEMISGVNLYMLVSAFTHRGDMSLGELVEKVISDGQKSIKDVRQMFLTRSGAA
jgi:mannose/fructose-specific phosphotransferase system component IIA